MDLRRVVIGRCFDDAALDVVLDAVHNAETWHVAWYLVDTAMDDLPQDPHRYCLWFAELLQELTVQHLCADMAAHCASVSAGEVSATVHSYLIAAEVMWRVSRPTVQLLPTDLAVPTPTPAQLKEPGADPTQCVGVSRDAVMSVLSVDAMNPVALGLRARLQAHGGDEATDAFLDWLYRYDPFNYHLLAEGYRGRINMGVSAADLRTFCERSAYQFWAHNAQHAGASVASLPMVYWLNEQYVDRARQRGRGAQRGGTVRKAWAAAELVTDHERVMRGCHAVLLKHLRQGTRWPLRDLVTQEWHRIWRLFDEPKRVAELTPYVGNRFQPNEFTTIDDYQAVVLARPPEQPSAD